MDLSPTFRELLSSFLSENVQFLVIGGYAVIAHGYPRMTRDLDLWIECSAENARRVTRALETIGIAVPPTVRSSLASPSHLVVLGMEPNRIDLVTGFRDFAFPECHARRMSLLIDGLALPFVSLPDLRLLKRAAGRFQDLADLENLPPD